MTAKRAASLDPFVLDFFAHARIAALPDELPDIRDRALKVLMEVARDLKIEGLPWSKWKFLERAGVLMAAYHEIFEISPTPWRGVPTIGCLIAKAAVDRRDNI